MNEQRTFLTTDGRELTVPRSVNPCIALYGPGPEGMTCGRCDQMYYVEYARRYWKCGVRDNTGGPATDHRRGWPTCGKFQQREGR